MVPGWRSAPRPRKPGAAGTDREDFRAALEQALAEVDGDERLGPLIGATGLRMRFEFTDLEMALNVASARGRHQPHLVVCRRPRVGAEAGPAR